MTVPAAIRSVLTPCRFSARVVHRSATLVVCVLIALAGLEALTHVHGVTDPHTVHTLQSVLALGQMQHGFTAVVRVVVVRPAVVFVGVAASEGRDYYPDPRGQPRSQRGPPGSPIS